MSAVATPLRWSPLNGRRLVQRNAWTLGVYALLLLLLLPSTLEVRHCSPRMAGMEKSLT